MNDDAAKSNPCDYLKHEREAVSPSSTDSPSTMSVAR